ncbi:DnaD domain protein [Aminipila luticellarii]|uniref:DnaD domain protein n=1 Tax=Aminipila luticellarii TaxID=2507160 RepID=A0A410PSC9_9FIRM|nr:DnaD domain protein [Aminipila luticellarii]QAT41768.1 DnaD domain protein [Aminipila luticellarii]
MRDNFIKKKASELYLLDTNVENVFISEYMAGAPSDYVKVYLFALMYAGAGHYMDNETIAKQLAMADEDILKAWSYWEALGVIEKHFDDPKDRFHYGVEFINLKELLYGKQTKKSKEKKSGKDINNKLIDVDIKEMYHSIEKITGRLLGGKEPMAILSWIEDFGAEPEMIVYAYSYCKNMRKRDSANYVGTVVKEWAQKNLRTKEEIEAHLQEIDNRHYLYKRVMKALGFNRNATEQEKHLMDSWFGEMEYTLEKVLEACSKTSGISNPNINYVHKILKNWREESGHGSSGGNSSEKAGGSKSVNTGTVLRYYDMIREKEEAEAAERRQQVYKMLPEIKQIDEEVRELGMKLSRIMVSGADNAKEQLERFRVKIDALGEEKAFKLTENNFSVDYMEVRYKCEQCKDTGTNDMGERCSCFNERLSEAEIWQNSSKKM